MAWSVTWMFAFVAATVVLVNADQIQPNSSLLSLLKKLKRESPTLHGHNKNGPGVTRKAPMSAKAIQDEVIAKKGRKTDGVMADAESKLKKMPNFDKVSRTTSGCGTDGLTTRCADGTCIFMWYIGDNDRDCSGANEDHEPTKSNMCSAAGGYLCSSGCRHLIQMCDGAYNCGDFSDENVATCKAQKYRCTAAYGNFLCPQPSYKTPRCIPNKWLCDNEYDCPGHEDEQNCASNPNPTPAPTPAPTTTSPPGNSGSSNSGSGSSNAFSSGGLSNAGSTCSYNGIGQNVCILNSVSGATLENNCLYSHNKARSFHNSGNLVWNTGLEQSARNYAKKLTEYSNLAHSTGNYGENLYYSGNTNDVVASCADAVYSWYSEVEYPLYNNNNKRLYNYNGDNLSGTGHFTQVVWKGSTSVGCGVSKKQTTKVFSGMTFPWYQYYVVCQYSPPGNVITQFTQNVPVPVAVYNVNSAADLKP